ncbi:MAG: hypothetical protein K6A65_03330 [Succinivibrionaceae bacterium]|nr:hypothetical protein [Succinivibrionaceae bacterium]
MDGRIDFGQGLYEHLSLTNAFVHGILCNPDPQANAQSLDCASDGAFRDSFNRLMGSTHERAKAELAGSPQIFGEY